MGELIREIPDHGGPLCPNSIDDPIHEAHQLHVRVTDAFYAAADRDADGEMPDQVAKAYSAATYSEVTNRMRLYRDVVAFVRDGKNVTVEAWYFRCRVCGLVLTAFRP